MEQINPNAFQGCLSPEPYTFTIGVDRLIIREDSVTFDFQGVVQGEPWSLPSGEVLQRENGYYYGAGRYEGQESIGWRIWLLSVSIIEGECYIEGLWFEPEDHDNDPSSGYFWTFGGSLVRLVED